MFFAAQAHRYRLGLMFRVQPQETISHTGEIQKLVIKNGAWSDRRWNARWLELHKGELRYHFCAGGKLIDRISADQISDVKLVMPELKERECSNENPQTGTENINSPENEGKGETLWDVVSTLHEDFGDLNLSFLVSTKPDQTHRGREYIFKTSSSAEAQEWVQKVNKMVAESIPPPLTTLSWCRLIARRSYKSTSFQIVVALMIFTNFLAFVYETQVNPDPDSADEQALNYLDIALSVAFAIELSINIFCHDFLSEFVPSVSNWFDFAVVITSIVGIPLNDVPGLNELRLVRVMRIFRLFKSIPSLRKIVGALRESVPAVGNALGLVALMCAIYAILGVTFFRDTDPADFGDFATAMFTLYQFLTFDNSSAITLNLMQLESTDGGQFGAALYMISFQIFMAYTLMNIGMAVLLEEFGASSQRAREEEEARHREKVREQTRKPLDPLMAHLSTMESEEALEAEIQELFHFIDEDGSGSVDFLEMRNGFARMEMSPPITFEREHFDELVAREGLLDEGGLMSAEHFGELVRRQLREYELTQMSRSVSEGRMQDKVNAILRSLKEVVSVTRVLGSLEEQLLYIDNRLAELEAAGRAKAVTSSIALTHSIPKA